MEITWSWRGAALPLEPSFRHTQTEEQSHRRGRSGSQKTWTPWRRQGPRSRRGEAVIKGGPRDLVLGRIQGSA